MANSPKGLIGSPIGLNPSWSVIFEDGSPEPYVLLRISNGAEYRFSNPNEILAEMRDRLGKIDPEKWMEVLRLRTEKQLTVEKEPEALTKRRRRLW